LVRTAANWTLENGFVTKDIDNTNFYFTSTIGDLICDFIQNKFPDGVNQANIELRKSTII
jgi:3-isopropylmalate dehydrogenase